MVNDTTITADSPAGTGVVDVTVFTAGGTSATSPADQFTYVTAPAVTSLSPTDGPPAGGTEVTITGTGFTGATAVEFGSTPATGFIVNSATSITADSPAGSGAVDVTVVTAGGTSATSLADQFTYVAAPTVTALNPAAGPLGGDTSVTITGTGFTGATAVDFGATPAASFTVNSATSITADSPSATNAGAVDVTVITTGGTSQTSPDDLFSYSAPSVTIIGGPLALGSTTTGTPGSPQSYTVSGANLTADLVITPPTGVELSDDAGTTWNTSLSLTPDAGAVASTMIEARIGASASAGTISGAIANTSTGATEQDVTVGGTVKDESQGDVVSSSPQTFYGEEVTFTATFGATSGGPAAMSGTVAFYDGTTYLGTAPLVANGTAALPSGVSSPAASPATVSGQASLATTGLTVGSHIITAVYSGDANYSAATSQTPVSVQVVPATSTTTLTAATTVQGTKLTANVVVTSPGNPPVVGTVAFYDGTTLLGTEPVVDGVATLDVASLAPGMHSFGAVFTGDGTTSTSQTSLVISTASPTVTRVVRYGFHSQPTYLLLTFSTALDPSSAQDVSNYSLLGPIHRRGVPSYAVGIESAVYDSATHTVTLKLSQRWNIHWRWQLTVNGTTPVGVKGASGAMLDGEGRGQSASVTTAGSDYVTMVSMKNLAGRASKLPTLGLIDSISAARSLAMPAVARGHATPHSDVVDHLLERGLLHVSARHARR